MSCCPPSCVVPCATPSVGFGSCGVGSGGFGGVPASALGLTSGGNIGCLTQIPPSEMTIQPPALTVVIPGPILASNCEPLRVGAHAPCAPGGYRGGFGGGFGGSICGGLQGVCSSKPFCLSPC